jgi:hypothetical protein
LLPVEIDTWEIADGRLFPAIQQGRLRKFAQEKADANWPKLVETKGK